MSHVGMRMHAPGDLQYKPDGTPARHGRQYRKDTTQRLGDCNDPAYVANAKKIAKDVQFGQPRPAGTPRGIFEMMRDFHYHHPRVSIVAGVAGICTLSTALGLACGFAIDALAHATDRKNDKAGLVVGLFVGLATALAQSISMFGLARRGEIASCARSFDRSSKTADGQSYHLISKRSPITIAAMRRNANSLLGWQHDALVYNNLDVLDGLNEIIRLSQPKTEWSQGIDEYAGTDLDKVKASGRPYWVATKSAPHAGIVAGRIYVSKYRTVNEFLQAEANAAFSDLHKFDEDLFKSGAQNKTQAEFTQKLRELLHVRSVSHDGPGFPDNDSVSQAMYQRREELLKSNVGRSLEVDFEKAAQTIYLGVKDLDNDAFKTKLSHDLTLDGPAQKARDMLYALKMTAYSGREVANKSYVRIDELTKVSQALTGLRAPSLYTFVANLRDSVFAGLHSAVNGENQGTAAGNQLFLFLPLAVIISVVSVLVLGMSSTSPCAGSNQGSGKGKNGQNNPNNVNTNNVTGFSFVPPPESVQNPNGIQGATVPIFV